MNAYELADELVGIADDTRILEAAIKIRQQADRIAELEKWEERWSKRCQRQQDEIAKLSHPVKQLTLDMIYKVSEATPINNEDEWFDNFAKNLIKEITE